MMATPAEPAAPSTSSTSARRSLDDFAVMVGYLSRRTPPPSYNTIMMDSIRHLSDTDGVSTGTDTETETEIEIEEQEPQTEMHEGAIRRAASTPEVLLVAGEYLFAFALPIAVFLVQYTEDDCRACTIVNDSATESNTTAVVLASEAHHFYSKALFVITLTTVLAFELIKLSFTIVVLSLKQKFYQIVFNLWIFISGLLIIFLILNNIAGYYNAIGATKQASKVFLDQCLYLNQSLMNFTQTSLPRSLRQLQNFCTLIPSLANSVNIYMVIYLMLYLNNYRKWNGMWFLQSSLFMILMMLLLQSVLFLPQLDLENPGRILTAVILGMSAAIVNVYYTRPCPSYPPMIDENRNQEVPNVC